MSQRNNESNRPTRNVKTTLIEPFKQIKFGLYIFSISTTFLIAAGALFFNSFWEQYQHVMGLFNIVDPNLQWELVTNDVFYNNLLRVGILFLVFFGVLSFTIFKLTHKYYGPLVSIERFVEQISEGDYSRRITIRRGDEMQRLVNKLNHMADNLQSRHVSGSGDSGNFQRKRSDDEAS